MGLSLGKNFDKTLGMECKTLRAWVSAGEATTKQKVEHACLRQGEENTEENAERQKPMRGARKKLR